MNKPFGLSIISSYLPRLCGIATFTHDLTTSIRNLSVSGEYLINIGAINVEIDGYKYSSDVKFEIRDNNINDFSDAAYYLNLSDSESISIQHEFGLYGGMKDRRVDGTIYHLDVYKEDFMLTRILNK
jgi:hypothetical protein